MNYKDNIEWLKSLKQQIGQTQHRDLWHFEQVIDETIENLKPLAKPHGRLIDADRFLDWLKEFHPNNVVIMSGVKNARTIIEAEGVNE